jgi:hypothetical protein
MSLTEGDMSWLYDSDDVCSGTTCPANSKVTFSNISFSKISSSEIETEDEDLDQQFGSQEVLQKAMSFLQ